MSDPSHQPESWCWDGYGHGEAGWGLPPCLPWHLLLTQEQARALTQVLDVIAPPYTSDFVQLFLPILENDSIAGTIKTEGEHDPVTEFIGEAGAELPAASASLMFISCLYPVTLPCFAAHCKSNFIMVN